MLGQTAAVGGNIPLQASSSTPNGSLPGEHNEFHALIAVAALGALVVVVGLLNGKADISIGRKATAG
jgi:hypothetical protein